MKRLQWNRNSEYFFIHKGTHFTIRLQCLLINKVCCKTNACPNILKSFQWKSNNYKSVSDGDHGIW